MFVCFRRDRLSASDLMIVRKVIEYIYERYVLNEQQQQQQQQQQPQLQQNNAMATTTGNGSSRIRTIHSLLSNVRLFFSL